MSPNELLVSGNFHKLHAHGVKGSEPIPSSEPVRPQPEPPAASPYLSQGGPCLWASRSQELAASCPTRQGPAIQSQACCCSNPALGGLFPLEAGHLLDPSVDRKTPKPLQVLRLSLKGKRTCRVEASGAGPPTPPGGRNRAVHRPVLPPKSSLSSPLLPSVLSPPASSNSP